MQELIENLNKCMNQMKPNGYTYDTVKEVTDMATQLLEKEKQQIVDAYDSGFRGNIDSENYYTQTFTK